MVWTVWPGHLFLERPSLNIWFSWEKINSLHFLIEQEVTKFSDLWIYIYLVFDTPYYPENSNNQPNVGKVENQHSSLYLLFTKRHFVSLLSSSSSSFVDCTPYHPQWYHPVRHPRNTQSEDEWARFEMPSRRKRRRTISSCCCCLPRAFVPERPQAFVRYRVIVV